MTAERAFLGGLGGGCSVPVAAYARAESRGNETVVRLTGLVISEDGTKAIQVDRTGADAQLLGQDLAQEAIAQGASEILNAKVMK